MATETVTARELAVLVKPVRALLRKNQKINAIKLALERTGCGLKECMEFVKHVQAWPGGLARCEGREGRRTLDSRRSGRIHCQYARIRAAVGPNLQRAIDGGLA